MTTAHVEPTLQDLPDGPGLLTEANDGQIMRWDAGLGRMVMVAIPRPVVLSSGGGGGSGGGSQAPHNHDALYAAISHNHDGVYALVGHTHEGGDDHDHNGTYALVGHNHDDRYVLLADYTAADVLAKLLTVDGAGSGLDADLLDGESGAYYLSRANHSGTQAASTISDFTEAAQDAVGGALTDSSSIDFTYDDAGNTITAIVIDASITNAKLANMAQATIKGRASGAGTGVPTDLSAAQVRTLINVADGANAYVHPNHSGDVTSVSDGATTIANSAVTNAKMANMAQSTIKGRASGAGTGAPVDLSAAQVAAIVEASITHNNIGGLTTGDPHTQYILLAGRAGGQTVNGGTAASDTLTLRGTSNAAPGTVVLNPNGGDVVIGDTTALARLHVNAVTPTLMLRRTNNNSASYLVYRNSGSAEIWRVGHRSGSSDNNLYIDRESGTGAIVFGEGGEPGADVVVGPTGGQSGRFRVAHDTAGETLTVVFQHLDNTNAASHSRFRFVTQPGGGDPFVRFDANSAWAMGIDQSDSGHFKLSNAGALGTNDAITVTNTTRFVGIGTTSPQGKLHGHDGTGGFLFVTKTGVAGTAVTIIPDGTGDVTDGMVVLGYCRDNTGESTTFGGSIVAPGGTININHGGGAQTATIAVSAGGAVTVQRTAGTRTFNFTLWLVWR